MIKIYYKVKNYVSKNISFATKTFAQPVGTLITYTCLRSLLKNVSCCYVLDHKSQFFFFSSQYQVNF